MTTPPRPHPVAPARTEQISLELRESALAALLGSGLVREHTCLHSLLTYLGRKALEDGGESLKEYTIGVEALGKPADYDPRLDPSVRVEIAKLRSRVREYYQGPGAASPVHLEIPKGQYRLRFVRPAEHLEGEVRDARRSHRWLAAAAVLGGLLLAVLLVVAKLREPHARALEPEMAAFWAAFLGSPKPTLISYGTPLFLKLDRAYYRDPYINREDDAAGSDDLSKVERALRSPGRRFVVNFTGVGEAEGLFTITRLLASQGVALSLQRSAHLSWEDMKGRNVIMLGSHKFNAQIPELPVKPKFQAASRPSRIVNLSPGEREPHEYLTVTAGPNGEILQEYALVSVYRGFTEGTQLLVLSCSSTEGTAAAAEYVTRADGLRELFREMGLDPSRPRLPPAFQVVVGARMKDGVPVQLAHVAHHVLAP